MIEFEEGISTPENWLRQSWQMFEASKALYLNMSADEVVLTEQDTFRQVGAFKGAMLLMGLAVENALKGAFVHQFPPDLSRDKLDQNHFKEKGSAHDLVAIANKMNFHLSAENFELLKRLTVFIEWASKYQAPLRKAEHKNAKGNLKLNWPSDYQLVETLINELQLLAGYKVGHGW